MFWFAALVVHCVFFVGENRKSPRVRFPRFLGKPNLRPEGEDQLCGTIFFPNSFSYGVFASIGSGAVPGRLPGGQVPGVPNHVPNHGFQEVPGVPDRF